MATKTDNIVTRSKSTKTKNTKSDIIEAVEEVKKEIVISENNAKMADLLDKVILELEKNPKEPKPKSTKPKKTQVERFDSYIQLILDTDNLMLGEEKLNKDHIKKIIGKKVSVKSEFSTKTKRDTSTQQPSKIAKCRAEFMEVCNAKGKTYNMANFNAVWNILKNDPTSEYFTESSKKHVKKYEGVAPGQPIENPDKPGEWVMGSFNKPVKKGSEAYKKLMEDLQGKDGASTSEDESEVETEEEEEEAA